LRLRSLHFTDDKILYGRPGRACARGHTAGGPPPGYPCMFKTANLVQFDAVPEVDVKRQGGLPLGLEPVPEIPLGAGWCSVGNLGLEPGMFTRVSGARHSL